MTERGWLALGVAAGLGTLTVAAALTPGAIGEILADGLPVAVLGSAALAAFPIARLLRASRLVQALSSRPLAIGIGSVVAAVASAAASGGPGAGPIAACTAFGLFTSLAVFMTRSGAIALTPGAESADSLTMTPPSTDTEAGSQRARAA